MKVSSTLFATAAVVALSSTAVAFSATPHNVGVGYTSYKSRQSSSILHAATMKGVDTDATLPSFTSKEEYIAYLKAAGKLPSGFAVGTATGEFVSVEAPAMGKLPIKATVIHLTEGPTDSWAAVFTSNKVCWHIRCTLLQIKYI